MHVSHWCPHRCAFIRRAKQHQPRSKVVTNLPLFIDDSTANLEAASALGLQTLLVINGMDWRPALVARLQ